MADCSQHLVQIMESQTRFDLNAAVQKWLQELAAQPNLTLEARRELEAHVRDTVTELQGRGLNDEESFWLARRRAGQPSELNQEFGKADPAKACREGVLWIAVVFFCSVPLARMLARFYHPLTVGLIPVKHSKTLGSPSHLVIDLSACGLACRFCGAGPRQQKGQGVALFNSFPEPRFDRGLLFVLGH